MEIQHLRFKVFAEEPVRIDLGDAIPVFHRWIQEKACDELLIDVADYRHVPVGPGVLLVGHEANYSLDQTGNRLGLLYSRKVSLPGDLWEKLAQGWHAATAACRRLEQEPVFRGQLRFDDGDCEISVNDRLLAPNTAETFAWLKPEIERFFETLWGPGAADVEHTGEPRQLLRVRITQCRKSAAS